MGFRSRTTNPESPLTKSRIDLYRICFANSCSNCFRPALYLLAFSFNAGEFSASPAGATAFFKNPCRVFSKMTSEFTLIQSSLVDSNRALCVARSFCENRRKSGFANNTWSSVFAAAAASISAGLKSMFRNAKRTGSGTRCNCSRQIK